LAESSDVKFAERFDNFGDHIAQILIRNIHWLPFISEELIYDIKVAIEQPRLKAISHKGGLREFSKPRKHINLFLTNSTLEADLRVVYEDAILAELLTTEIYLLSNFCTLGNQLSCFAYLSEKKSFSICYREKLELRLKKCRM
jgi:hypothetical protein